MNQLGSVPEIECNHNIIPKIWRIVGQLRGPGFTEVKSVQILQCQNCGPMYVLCI